MKMSHKLLALLLLTLVFSGCSSCPSKKKAAEAPSAVIPQAEAAEPVMEKAAPAEPVEESVPVATRKYVNK